MNTKAVSDSVEKLLLEHKEISDRIDELDAFIQSDKLTEVTKRLNVEGVDLLILQLETMRHYRSILEMRLNLEGLQSIND